MRRKILILLLVIVCCSDKSWSQDFLSFRHQLRVELSLDMFNLRQNGAIYLNPEGHNPALYYEPEAIAQGTSCPGIGIRTWYAWNFGMASFEKIACGIETGIHINAGRANLSVDLPEQTKGTNIRIPILASFRRGACVDRRYYGKTGFCIAAGIEIIRSSIPNENGTFILPKIEGMVNLMKVNFFVGIYPLAVKSYYLLNGQREIRQRTTFYDFGFRFGITGYAKKYRGRKKLDLFDK